MKWALSYRQSWDGSKQFLVKPGFLSVLCCKVSELSHSERGLQLLSVLQHILKCSPSIFCC